MGKHILSFLLGDSAYPLSLWLMKPIPHNTILTSSQQTFNYRLSRALIVVDNAFGRLKAKWRRLMKQNDMDISHAPKFVTCCNLQVHGDSVNGT